MAGRSASLHNLCRPKLPLKLRPVLTSRYYASSVWHAELHRLLPEASKTSRSNNWRFIVRQDRFESEKASRKLAEELSSGKKLFDRAGMSILSSILLRDACRCAQCVDPSTKQRNFSFVDIPRNVRALPGEPTQDGRITVKWSNDISGYSDHLSSFSLQELVALAIGQNTVTGIPEVEPKTWDAAAMAEKLVTVSYDNYMNSDEHLLTVIKTLFRDGLLFVKDVPPSVTSINDMVERIGPIRNTFYGSTWDVRSKPDAENVAYTHKDLGFHMDLLYMKEPPAFQFLHCIQNTCSGGESRFADTRRAREIMEADHYEQATRLRRQHVTYGYDNLGHSYVRSWAIFPRLGEVFWSPPFVTRFGDHLQQSNEYMQEALSAAKVFNDILERKSLVYETKMEEGTCVIFRNTRVVHARNAFDVNTGQRWLRGAYLDLQPFSSMYRRLMRQMSGED